MKKIFIIIVIVLLFSGCDIANTPTSKVEDFLSRYQRLDGDFSSSYNQISGGDNINDENRNAYKKLVEKQYKSLSYEIKEEEIDGNSATVTAQIKVFDYKEIINKYNKGNYDINEYHKTIIKDLEKQKDKIVYTIEFKLNKTDNDKWGLTALQIDDQKKLLGIN